MTYTDIATRALVVSMKCPFGGKTSAAIAAKTGLSVRQIDRIYARAIERGFDPNQDPLIIKDSYVEDKKRSGRPKKQTEEAITTTISKVRTSKSTRTLTCTDLSEELRKAGIDVSASTVFRMLAKAGFRKCLPTKKPGLTPAMRIARYKWCLEREHWTLDDWKSIIWTDETSVLLHARKGGHRVWRTSVERYDRSCIARRFKGYSEFMFWGSFCYDSKGPGYCWPVETAQERRIAEAHVKEMNRALEPKKKLEWEAVTAIQRLRLRQQPGRRPTWRWNEANGKLVRRSKGGIDWYRYQQHIILKRLIPYAKECEKKRPNMLVQEDKAPAHAHWIQQEVYDAHKVQRLLWPGNSPDLNAIECAWEWMKRHTTKEGRHSSRSEAIRAWERSWAELPQVQIQAWIERIPRHV